MTSTSPAISVLMPAYNAERYLEEAVRSILVQTFTDFELLIVDDGSTDRTRSILQRLSGEDARVRFVSRPNTGLVGALNELLGEARGPLLARMDADDVALPDRFARQVAFLDAHPEVVCVGGRVMLIDPDGLPLGEGHRESDHDELIDLALTGICPMNHPSLLMRRGAVDRIGGYRPESYPAEDLDLLLRLAGEGRLANLPVVVTRYRLHPDSISERRQHLQIEKSRKVVAEASARLGLPDRFADRKPWRPSDRASRLRFALWFGWSAYRHRKPRSAIRYGLKAIAVAPWYQEGWRLLACAVLKSPKAEAEGSTLASPEPRASTSP